MSQQVRQLAGGEMGASKSKRGMAKVNWAYLCCEDHSEPAVGLMLKPHGPQQLHIASIHIAEVGYGGAGSQIAQRTLQQFAPVSTVASNAIVQLQTSESSFSVCAASRLSASPVAVCKRNVTILALLLCRMPMDRHTSTWTHWSCIPQA